MQEEIVVLIADDTERASRECFQVGSFVLLVAWHIWPLTCGKSPADGGVKVFFLRAISVSTAR